MLFGFTDLSSMLKRLKATWTLAKQRSFPSQGIFQKIKTYCFFLRHSKLPPLQVPITPLQNMAYHALSKHILNIWITPLGKLKNSKSIYTGWHAKYDKICSACKHSTTQISRTTICYQYIKLPNILQELWKLCWKHCLINITKIPNIPLLRDI